jgi:hypothetical protein
MPAVNPVVTGWGMNWISRPILDTPRITRMIPAMNVASIRPPTPKRCETGARSTTKAAVGPETFVRAPPSAAITAPATIEV